MVRAHDPGHTHFSALSTDVSPDSPSFPSAPVWKEEEEERGERSTNDKCQKGEKRIARANACGAAHSHRFARTVRTTGEERCCRRTLCSAPLAPEDSR